MGYYKDLREYMQVLEQNNCLVRFKREINKDTELMPLVRWQFRGLPSKGRKAFFFDNVTDVKGKKYQGASLDERGDRLYQEKPRCQQGDSVQSGFRF